ncbi:MAG: hypothetical protein ACD_21C00228G0003 [uncultured bacterium]|nr:MAG: hypothetical protein ACD_21C00228G0003 [uncultured bacterium]
MKITAIKARGVYDSMGLPTLEVELENEKGQKSFAMAQRGLTKGEFRYFSLRLLS